MVERQLVKVVNRHHYKGEWPPNHFYIGRPGGIARQEIARGAIDATLFGNPFTLKEHGNKALELYKRHLWDLIRLSPENLQALLALPPDAVLVCSCKEKPGDKPRPCHGEVVVRCWEFLFRKRRRRQRVLRLTKFEKVVSPGAAKARELVGRRAHG